MNEEQLSDIWLLFKEYLDKKQIDMIAEKYVDLMAGYGVTDDIFQDCIGTDNALDDAISYYLELDSDNEDWD